MQRLERTTRSPAGQEIGKAGAVRIPGVPITDPAWAAARRGRRPPNFGRTFPPEPLTVSEVVSLILACDSRRSYIVARDRALLVVLWRCGGRIREVLSLHPKDLDLNRGGIHVLHGKAAGGRRGGRGPRDRWIGIDPMGARFVQRWLEERIVLGVPAGTPLFCTVLQQRHRQPGPWRAISAPYVRNWLKQLGLKAGIEKRVHPHQFRHTHTNELVAEDLPLRIIQAQLGHWHLASTEAYIQRISAPDLLRTIAERPWPDQARTLLGLGGHAA
jgi:integrase/recombinase XerD